MSELESQVPFSTPIPSCNIVERARVWTRVNMQTITQNPSIAEPSLTSLGGMQRCRGGGAVRVQSSHEDRHHHQHQDCGNGRPQCLHC